ncbi:MAG: hypothetical protein GXN99_02245, partial [Candidatus Nanohaloarchaeota archaeon]|nr:hypothetical protein [Candidatus Nanohaloarchaeota archaeon]
LINLSYNGVFSQKLVRLYNTNSCFNISVPYLPVENQTLNLTLTALAGSFILTKNSTTIMYDGLAPNISVNISNYSITSFLNYPVKVRVSDANSIINASLYNGNSANSLTYEVNLSLHYGLNTITFYAYDLAGNMANLTFSIFAYNNTYTSPHIKAYVSNSSAWIVNELGYDSSQGYFINFTPIFPLEVFINFTFDENEVLKHLYKVDETGNYTIPFYINGSNYCSVYINTSQDPLIVAVVEATEEPTTSLSASSSSSSGSGSGGFYYSTAESSVDNTTFSVMEENQSTQINSSYLFDNNASYYNFSNSSHAVLSLINASNEIPAENRALPYRIVGGVLLVLLIVSIILYYIVIKKSNKEIFHNYDVLGSVSKDVYYKVKQFYLCKTYKNPLSEIDEAVYIIEGDKGWKGKLLLKKKNGEVLVAKPHNATA